MTSRGTLVALTTVLAAALIAVAGAFAPKVLAEDPPAGGRSENRIEADAANLRSSNGTFRCELFNSARGFPRDGNAAVGHQVVRVENKRAVCVFQGVAPGEYAVVAMHDENDNGKMDYNFLGIPAEGYGFSDDPRMLLKAPAFDAAKFRYDGGVLRVPIHLHYF
jgi:uncharacterized protein (DUF2141 family)